MIYLDFFYIEYKLKLIGGHHDIDFVTMVQLS